MTTATTTTTTTTMFFQWLDSPLWALGRLIFRRFTITLFRHTTLGRSPLEEGPARRRDLYLTTHNTHKRHISMLPAGFEPTIPVSEPAADPRLRPHGYWDRPHMSSW
jgi:hypothetical protein